MVQQEKQNVGSSAADVSRKVARRGAKEARKAARRFVTLVGDTSKTVFGVGQRRVNRRNNRTTIGRYINDIITLAETSHIAGLHVDLSQVLVEPRFLPPPDLAEPVREDEVVQEVFYVMPRMPDMPQILAPYNLPSLRIPDLTEGHRRVLILGTPGSGRTTALMALALWALREIQFPEKDDPVKQRIEAELEKLDPKERQKREREREETLAAAREQLESAIAQGEVSKANAVTADEAFKLDEEEANQPLPAFNTLTPLYIHLADLNLTAREFGSEVDPAEPFMRALQRSVSTLTARTIPRMIYQRLEDNQALILMDGYAELPAAEQERVLAWLRAFLAQYGNNFIVMTGPATGYGELVQQDFSPVFMKPWNSQDIGEAIAKYADAFPLITGTKRRPGEEITPNARKRVAAESFGLSPVEVTLKIWAMYSDENVGYNLSEWLEVFVRSQLPANQSYEFIVPFLGNAGALQTERGFIRRQWLEVLFKQQEAAGAMVITQEALQQLDADAPTEADAADSDDDSDELENEDEAAANRTRMLQTLVFAGLLHRYRSGRYRYRHSIFADYFAAITLRDLPRTSPASLYVLAQRPQWRRAFAHAARYTNLDNVVRMKLMANPDLLHTDLLDMAQWLAYTDEIPPDWRGEILKRLGNAFVNPNQFIANRERIACALVAGRDVEGALNIFEYGLSQPDPDVRRLSALGAGALGNHGQRLDEAIIDLLAAPEEDVQLAAAHALGALQTEFSRQAMEQALQEGDQKLQQAVAEAFAGMPQNGYETLHALMEHNEMFVRRAALFGVRRIETEWAQDVIRQRFMHETQSFVHLLAQESFLRQIEGNTGLQPPPSVADIDWVYEWADAFGIDLPADQPAHDLLAYMMTPTNTDLYYRVLGTVLAGQLGVVQTAQSLYSCLQDPDPIVRQAAYKSLIDMQVRIGERLPDPL